jgi:hypothetical protein
MIDIVDVVDDLFVKCLDIVIRNYFVKGKLLQSCQLFGGVSHSFVYIGLCVHASVDQSHSQLLQRGRLDEYVVPVGMFGLDLLSPLDIDI